MGIKTFSKLYSAKQILDDIKAIKLIFLSLQKGESCRN